MNILVIAPYTNIFPPQNGGMIRCSNIIKQLNKNNNVTVIAFQKRESFFSSNEHEYKFKKIKYVEISTNLEIPFWLKLIPIKYQKSLQYRFYKRELFQSADIQLLYYYKTLISLLKSSTFDVVVLENLSCLSAVSIIRRYDKKVSIVYDAYNFDTHLAENDYLKGLMPYNYYQKIKRQESNLYKMVNLIWCCSDIDKHMFDQANRNKVKCTVIPNGIKILPLQNTASVNMNIRSLIFCGSIDYFPNSEGLLWFINNCWPKLKNQFPNLFFTVISSGKASDLIKSKMVDNGINFMGRVNDVGEYYNKASVSIVPLLSGSGTRLKVLEAMSFGVPIVSTEKGAEGILYKKDIDILIANDPDNFVAAIANLLTNVSQRKQISESARSLVETKYDWNCIGDVMQHSLNQIVNFNSK